MRSKYARLMMDGSRYSERLATMSDSHSLYSNKQSLHERLQEHLETCSECQTGMQAKKTPNGFGTNSNLCTRYQDIIAVWAEAEGRINNIVAHDEYGNQASTHYHERYPDQWR